MQKRIELLPQVPQYFKAGLHIHSTVSDGQYTPEEIKRRYREKGYSILALTDHNVMAHHPELDDESFLTLAGGEFNINEIEMRCYFLPAGRSYHLNFIAKDPSILWQPFDGSRKKEAAVYHLDRAQIDSMPRVYDVDAVNAIIARANEHGYLVTYNHPIWSMQDWPDYAGLKGLWAMEVCNYFSLIQGLQEDNANIYHSLLRSGMHLYPVCADDMHNARALGGAWCMVGAKELTYPAVIDALVRGDFYASTGPEIHSLTLEDGILRVTCSDAASVYVQAHCRFSRAARPGGGEALPWSPVKSETADPAENGPLRSAQFDLSEWLEGERDVPNAFFRVTVNDAAGRYAVTRGYWISELPG